MRGKDYNAGLRGVLFEDKHYRKMGQAIWLFGWLVLRETRERDGIGFVLGGRPVNYREIEEETGFSRKSLERWMKILRRFGYVETTPGQTGITVYIRKAKKFLRRPSPTGTGRFPKGQQENVQKLWKISAKLPSPVPKSADTPLRFEEPPPHFCGGFSREAEVDSRLPLRIGSRDVERQIELQSELHSPIGSVAVEKHSSAISAEHFSCLGKEKNLNAELDRRTISHPVRNWDSSEKQNGAIPCEQGEAECGRELKARAERSFDR